RARGAGPALRQDPHLPRLAGRPGLPGGAAAARDRSDGSHTLRRRVQLAQPDRRSGRRPGTGGMARRAPRPARDPGRDLTGPGFGLEHAVTVGVSALRQPAGTTADLQAGEKYRTSRYARLTTTDL